MSIKAVQFSSIHNELTCTKVPLMLKFSIENEVSGDREHKEGVVFWKIQSMKN